MAPVRTRFVRIYPERATNEGLGLRLELTGCDLDGEFLVTAFRVRKKILEVVVRRAAATCLLFTSLEQHASPKHINGTLSSSVVLKRLLCRPC